MTLNAATINFSDGTKLTVKEGDLLIPIVKIENRAKCEESPFDSVASEGPPYSIWNHTSFQLTPSILELLFNCEYFRKINSPLSYHSKSVVSIENH